MDNLTIGDLLQGDNNVEITPLLLKRIFRAKMFGERSLEKTLPAFADMTAQTGREFSEIVYAKIPRELKKAKNIRSRVLNFVDFKIVPSLGSFHEVPDPEFFNSDLYREWTQKDNELVVPLIHIHTHPGGKPYPSPNDLSNATGRYWEIVNLGGSVLRLSNPTLNLIIGASHYPGDINPAAHSFTFYQLTSGANASPFLRKYDEQRAQAQRETRRIDFNYTPLTRNFMDRLVAADVCTYLHFPANSPTSLFREGEEGISKKDLDKITSTFAYKMGIEKRG